MPRPHTHASTTHTPTTHTPLTEKELEITAKVMSRFAMCYYLKEKGVHCFKNGDDGDWLPHSDVPDPKLHLWKLLSSHSPSS